MDNLLNLPAMVINQLLRERCNNACELCSKSDSQLTAYSVPPGNDHTVNEQVVLCSECMKQIVAKDYSNAQYWRFLEGSIWSETPSVQVLSYKILKELSSEDWDRDASENTSLDESLLAWAHAEEKMEAEKIIHKDCYGTILQTGDTVILKPQC